MSMVGNVLPSLALTLQRPVNGQLDLLSCEGLPALEQTPRKDPLVRGFAMAVPSLAAYLLALEFGAVQANSVVFASLISGGLVQTLHCARNERYLRWPLLVAAGGSLVLMGTTLAVPGISEVFGLTMPNLQGWGLVAGSATTSLVLRQLGEAGNQGSAALRNLWRQSNGVLANGMAPAVLPVS